jgi:hypothetical protein
MDLRATWSCKPIHLHSPPSYKPLEFLLLPFYMFRLAAAFFCMALYLMSTSPPVIVD